MPVLGGIATGVATAWGGLAHHYSGTALGAVRAVLAAGLVVVNGLALLAARRRPVAWLAPPLLFGGVLLWWLALPARNDRDWQLDVAALAWADITGDLVTVHNVRNNL